MKVLITGCSGGGKSTLLAELGRRGFGTVLEPGRRIVAEEEAGDGAALPWVDETAFAWRALKMAQADLRAVRDEPGPVFFDRGVIDAAVALEHMEDVPLEETLGGQRHYFELVFLAPPWPSIFVKDAARRHDLAAGVAEFGRLKRALSRLGYQATELPKARVEERAEFVLNQLGVGSSIY